MSLTAQSKNEKSFVRRATESIFMFAVVGLLIAVVILDLVYWDEVREFLKRQQAAHPILYPSAASLILGIFAYWIIRDILQGKRKPEGIYIYRVLLFGIGFLVFGVQAVLAVLNAF